jgi:membrane associated rhomboid family serine protease
MLLPIRTDRRLQHTPWVNYLLIAANVAMFILANPNTEPTRFFHLQLNSREPQFWSFITYQFLHADWMHLLGNMLFLWVFGNSVEDRLGKVGYLAFYLGGGVVAGLGHVLLQDAAVVGASGAVCAVTGAYLALFPMSHVLVFYFFFIIGMYEVSSIVLILFQIGINVVMSLVGGAGVAYLAHLSGYAYGFAVGMALLLVRLLPREPYDMLSMLEHRRKRMQFQALTRQGYQPWEAGRPGVPPPMGAPTAVSPEQQRLMAMRTAISDALGRHELDQAVRLYEELVDQDANQVMPRQQQLDLANRMMAIGHHDGAARAYELYLNTFKGDADREQVQLLLGLIYTRYLQRRQRARELLLSAVTRLQQPEQRALAQSLLREIEG